MNDKVLSKRKLELKPCPFCGGKATLIEIINSGTFRIECLNSGCFAYNTRTKFSDMQRAVDAWNRRVNENG